MTDSLIKIAEGLEADALTYPEERFELLVEAADAWVRAGRAERAVAVLTELVEQEPDQRCSARVLLVAIHLESGEAALADAQLSLLAKDPTLGLADCEMVAEALVASGDLPAAALWFDRAAARLTDEEIAAVRRDDGLSAAMARIMLRQRRDLRQQLGRDPDALDALAEQPSGTLPATAEELLAAAQHHGGTRADSARTSRFPPSLPGAATSSSPPGRNAPCPCGSDRKYKKCHGRS